VNANWKTEFLRSGSLLLEYKILVNEGKPWMLCIHGYGQDFHCFDPVYNRWSTDFSFAALHLPFHGESHLEGEKISMQHWARSIYKLFQKEGIDAAHGLAFSMGARFLLCAATEKPELFKSLTLLAPDGVVMNPWYHFATGSSFGRLLLRTGLLLFPFLALLIRILEKIRVLRPGLAKFSLSVLQTRKERARLLSAWIGFRLLWPEWHKLRSRIQGLVPSRIILAKFDSMIPVKYFGKLRKSEDWLEWQVLNTGHSGLIEKYAVEELS
jgi:pimeloyl-ACP methyl ester carboxylesterase